MKKEKKKTTNENKTRKSHIEKTHMNAKIQNEWDIHTYIESTAIFVFVPVFILSCFSQKHFTK